MKTKTNKLKKNCVIFLTLTLGIMVCLMLVATRNIRYNAAYAAGEYNLYYIQDVNKNTYDYLSEYAFCHYENNSTVQTTGSSGNWGLDKINAAGAREITPGRPAVKVGVIDTGIDRLHPNLAGIIYNSSRI